MRKMLVLLFCLLTACAAAAESEKLYPARGENGLWGYIGVDGVWMIVPQYDMASSFRGDFAVAAMLPEGVEYDSRWEEDYEGIIDRNGSFVVEPHYDFDAGYDGYLYGGEHTGLWLVMSGRDDEYREGFFDIPTGTFSGAKWNWVSVWCDDSDLIPVEGGYASRTTGELQLEGNYEWCDPAYFHDGIASVAMIIDEETEEVTDYFLINERGETIPLPDGVHSLYAEEYAFGRIPVVNDEGLYGYADGAGNIVIPLQYADAGSFCEGIACVEFPEGDRGYIDPAGKVIARGFARTYDFVCGYAEVWLSGHNAFDKVTAWINTKGEIVPFMDSDCFYPISEDRIWMRTGKEYSAPYHLLDGEGNILTGEPYNLMEMESWSFDEGLQAVRNADGKWGYIDLNGEAVIPFIYDAAYTFEGELAEVRLGDRVGYIDQAGNAVYMWDDPIR